MAFLFLVVQKPQFIRERHKKKNLEFSVCFSVFIKYMSQKSSYISWKKVTGVFYFSKNTSKVILSFYFEIAFHLLIPSIQISLTKFPAYFTLPVQRRIAQTSSTHMFNSFPAVF